MLYPPEYPILAEVLNTDVPLLLWHYTNPAGAIGICTSQTLLAGRGVDMNDLTEQRIAPDLVDNFLEECVHPRLRGFVEAYQELREADRPEARIFTVSLTTEADSLEQWRAYTPRSGGVAIGFEGTQLSSAASIQGFLVTPCVYDEELHVQICREVVSHAVELVMGGDDSADPRIAAAQLDRVVSQVAAILKHPSFKQENEWRLVSSPVWVDDNLRFLPSDSGIREYKGFMLAGAHEEPSTPWPLNSVSFVVGPNRDREAMRGALWRLGAKLGPEFAVGPVDFTKHPYR